jgi:hypothetical protein
MKSQSKPVQAVAFTCGWWPVIEHMAKMRATAPAMNLCPDLETKASIGLRADCIGQG